MTVPLPAPRCRRRGLLQLFAGGGAGLLLSACAPSPLIASDADRSPVPAPTLNTPRRDAARASASLAALADGCAKVADAGASFVDWCTAVAEQHRNHQVVLSQANPLGGVQTDHTPLEPIEPTPIPVPTTQAEAMTLLAAEETALAVSLSPSITEADQSASNALLWISLRLAAQVSAAAFGAASVDALGPFPVPGDAVPAETEVGDRMTSLQVLLGHQRALVFGLQALLGRLAADDPQVDVVGNRLGEAMRERDETAAQVTASRGTPVGAEPNYTLPGDITDPAQHTRVWAGLEFAVLAGWTRLAAASAADRETAADWAFRQAVRVRGLGEPLPFWPGWV